MPAVRNIPPRLSEFIRDPLVRRAFERAERDLPPAALAVAIEPVAPLGPGAAVRTLVEA